MGNPLMPPADYVRVEISAGGVIHTYELEPESGWPLDVTVTVDTDTVERSTDGLTVEFVPVSRRADIRVAGKLASAARDSASA